MDRDDLMSLLGAMQEGNVAVKPDGTVCNLDTSDEHDIEEVAVAVAELTADLIKLVSWAKQAPQYRRPGSYVTTGGEVVGGK